MREAPLFQAGLAIRFPPMSVDEITANSRSVGWELYYTQLRPEPFTATPYVVHTADMQVGLTDYGGGSMIVGAIPKGCVMLCFVADTRTVCNYRNRRLLPYEVIVATGRDEIDFVYNAPSTLVSLTLKETLFLEKYRDHFGREWRSGRETLCLDASGAEAFVGEVRAWMGRFFEPTALDYERAEEALIDRFFSLVREKPLRRSGTLSPQTLRKAREILHEHADTYYTIAQLAKETGLSQRNLQYLFKKHLGVSPKHYYLGVKFRRIRDEIIRGQHEPLAETALRHGFYHAGHFSAVYRRFFGELPSQTIRKKEKAFRIFASDFA